MSLYALATFALAVCMQSATAQAGYPDHLIKIIAPQAPGGGVDLVARVLAESLSRALKQPIIIDNEGGAGGVIACSRPRAPSPTATR
jgi:tripartite-type tricarboxylate transporter receptor subunit TctC